MRWVTLIILVWTMFFRPEAHAGGRLPTEIVDIRGQRHLLPSGNELGTVFIFISLDCPISNGYAPEINRLSGQYTNFNFYLVHVDTDLDVAAARKHAEEFGFRPPVVLDVKHQVVKSSGATITPEVAVFSAKGDRLYLGRIDNSYIAPMKKRMEITKHDLRDALDAILTGKTVSTPVTQAVGCYIP